MSIILRLGIYFACPVLLCSSLSAQLHQEIEHIAARTQGRVGVACSVAGAALDCNYNESAQLPMQSVYKLPIAMAVLHQVEEGRLSLAQEIPFLPGDIIPAAQHSPLRDAHPHGGVDVPVTELLRLAVQESDGVASDILLRVIGGPKAADTYIKSLGIEGMHIVATEKAMSRDVRAQYRNSTEPRAIVALLRLVADRSPLSPEHTQQLLAWMINAQTGEHRIRGSLPMDVVVADKTGTSGEDHGITHATNDVGLITLPGGKQLAVAVLIQDSPESEDDRESVIAEIARVIWAHAVKATQGNGAN